MGARPLIGVTTSEVRRKASTQPLPEGDPPQSELALGVVYARAVEEAGGLPVVLPPLESGAVPPLVERLSGICLSGGPDLDPTAYDADRHPQLGPVEPDLDVFELAVARRADALGLPILGICRGCQAINVARGGTLHQHLPDVTDGSVAHRQTASGPRADPRRDDRAGLAAGGDRRPRAARRELVPPPGRGPPRPRPAGRRVGARRRRRGDRGPRTASTSACSGTSRRSCTSRVTRALFEALVDAASAQTDQRAA